MNRVLFVALALAIGSAAQAADVEAGKKIASSVCLACHNANGISTTPIYPNLAGQHEQYLVTSIKAYKDGGRSGGNAAVMTPMVANLSDADIENVAAYYASLPASP